MVVDGVTATPTGGGGAEYDGGGGIFRGVAEEVDPPPGLETPGGGGT